MATYQHKTHRHASLIEVADPTAARIKFHAQGGGQVLSMSRATFLAEWELAPAPVFRRGAVTADFIEDANLALPCYGNGNLWNGWGMPYFTRETVDLLITAGSPLAWEGETVVAMMDGEREEYAPTPMPDGVTAWGVGAGGWVWDAVVFQQEIPAQSVDGVTRRVQLLLACHGVASTFVADIDESTDGEIEIAPTVTVQVGWNYMSVNVSDATPELTAVRHYDMRPITDVASLIADIEHAKLHGFDYDRNEEGKK